MHITEYTFGELEKDVVFIKSKKWYKKITEKDSSSLIGSAIDDQGRVNVFGSNQIVTKYENIAKLRVC